MLLADELRSLRERVEAIASFKERAFYKYLCRTPLDYPHGSELSEQEQVVLAAFCIGSPECKPLAQKIRGTKPIKGLHYSNNLIDLAAFASLSLDDETGNIKTYVKNHSTKDFFVLTGMFPDVLDYPPSPITEIDQIALKLVTGSLDLSDKPLMVSAIQTAEDLTDVYILNTAYLRLLDHQPATQYRRDAIAFAQQLSAIIRRIDMYVRLAVGGAAIYVFIKFYSFLSPIIVERWTQMEPRLYIVQLILASLLMVLLILVGVVPDRVKLIKGVLRFLGTLVLLMFGIKRRTAESSIARYLSQDTKQRELS